MLMLDKLHKMGYEKLRWMSYISPNGCALRCHIATSRYFVLDRDVTSLDTNNVFWISVGTFEKGNNIDELAETFIREYPRIAEAGRGSDLCYRKWYKELLAFAKKGKVPEFYGEWWTLPIGRIKIGETVFPAPPNTLRLISWNIDGIRAKYSSLCELIEKYSPDVVCLQKVKNSGEPIEIDGYRCFQTSVSYAGVCTYVRDNIPAKLISEYQKNPTVKGHLQKVDFIYPAFTLFNCYVPYSNPSIEGAIEHRKLYDKFLLSEVMKTSDRLILCGDLNIVHSEKDCWDEKFIRNQANFLDWERKNFERLMERGSLLDTFRHFNFWEKRYSYFFRNDPEVREKNQGHRIDYFLASKSFEPQIVRADIIGDVTTSTNNPILLDIEY